MKRPLLSFAPVAGIAALLLSACAGDAGRTAAPVAAHYDLLIGGYTEGPASSGLRKGVEVYRFDPATGDLIFLRENAGIRNPSWLLASPSGKHVYAVNELNGGKDAGRVSAFDFDAATGALKFVNDVPSGGDDPCHLARIDLVSTKFSYDFLPPIGTLDIPFNGRVIPVQLWVSNYTGGTTRVVGLTEDPPTDHRGLPRLLLQSWEVKSGVHMHSATPIPGYAAVCLQDLGSDTIDMVSAYSLKSRFTLRLPYGTGPRHLVFANTAGRSVTQEIDGRPAYRPMDAYLVGELNDTVTHLAVYPDARISIVKTYPLGETPAFKKGTAAAVRLSDDGRFLYATTRDPKNKIHVFAVDAATGALSPVQTIASGGRAPRDIVLSPDGRWMFAANQRSDGVAVFSRDPDSGRLTGPVKTLRSGSPSALIWVPAP